MSDICHRFVTDLSQICHRCLAFVFDLSQICHRCLTFVFWVVKITDDAEIRLPQQKYCICLFVESSTKKDETFLWNPILWFSQSNQMMLLRKGEGANFIQRINQSSSNSWKQETPPWNFKEFYFKENNIRKNWILFARGRGNKIFLSTREYCNFVSLYKIDISDMILVPPTFTCEDLWGAC